MMRSSLFKAFLPLVTLAFVLVDCAPAPTTAAPQPPVPTFAPTDTVLPSSNSTLTATAAQAPTATAVLLPVFSLKKGDFYFSEDGKVSFLFSRNVAGYQQGHYATLLGWARAGGTKFVRLSLDSFGMGFTPKGEVDANWAAQWDQVFATAEADGIYVLPAFSSWYDWNAGAGYSTWSSNPLNQAKGGPVRDPGELFQQGSAAQSLWLNWMQTLIQRWQGRNNILAWEVFSEVNLASGVSEQAGMDFVDSTASVIRAADSSDRPVTASIADTGLWPNFYRLASIDFINIHPYPPSAQLDRTIIAEVRNSLTTYKRPVLIGESGLSAATPDSPDGKLTVAANALLGIRHATWAAIVSGAMNGRALWWEDGVGIYFPALGIPWMQTYATEELPAANFVAGFDFSGFQPLISTSSSGVWGAAIGNEKSVIGWYRDASSEPPDWNLKPVITGQQVTLTVPGTALHWRVDFTSTKDGTTSAGAVFVTRKGQTITVPLPDFSDDIVFKAAGE